MKRLSTLAFICISIVIISLLAACNPVVKPGDNLSNTDNSTQVVDDKGNDSVNQDDVTIDDNKTGIGPDDIIKEYELLTDENLKEFSIYPACEKGKQSVGISYRFQLIQKQTIFQISENNFTFSDFDTYTGLIEKHKNYLICEDKCPENTTLHFEPGKVYYGRLLNHWVQGGSAISDVIVIDLTEGSEYMTKECNQAPDDVSCFDSDDLNYTNKGHVFANGKKFVDYCDVDNVNILYEFYCDGADKKVERKWCDKGCRDGYCKS